MSGSSIGTLFKVTTWGESHGEGIGVVVDGCPAGLLLNEEIIQIYLNRRRPGQSKYTTQRKEGDLVKILSGVFEGKTTGTPISMIVLNANQNSSDYKEIANYYRPGHADYTFDKKYGFRDYRGGGRSSGRETIGRVAAGAVAMTILEQINISVCAYTKSIGNISIDYKKCSKDNIMLNPLAMPDLDAAKTAGVFVEETMKNQDSLGGIVECIISGMPAGIGEPVFDKLDSSLGKAILSIGAVKGIEFGSGFMVSTLTGSINNDNFRYNQEGKVEKETNHSGGILGGISDGTEIIFRACIKPTPSVSTTQSTINKSGENISINIHGRHDPVIVPRAVVVVEAMTSITLVDLLFNGMTSTMDSVIKHYKS